ncbi:hypothetical protein DPEC_G00068340 [Dallia pectoralis]|uniref:Uncharacterized protein n=1 Tax=Dallia pectoralis TaxID=75939 RepID=A0ACC2H251_DALPE|nr:hypothetical protein DPEC_G00068340 [Dallia pectoralis]
MAALASTGGLVWPISRSGVTMYKTLATPAKSCASWTVIGISRLEVAADCGSRREALLYQHCDIDTKRWSKSVACGLAVMWTILMRLFSRLTTFQLGSCKQIYSQKPPSGA